MVLSRVGAPCCPIPGELLQPVLECDVEGKGQACPAPSALAQSLWDALWFLRMPIPFPLTVLSALQQLSQLLSIMSHARAHLHQGIT